MNMIDDTVNKIASIYGSDAANYALALEIVGLLDRHYANERNRLSEMLDRRTTELQRLQRLVGEEV